MAYTHTQVISHNHFFRDFTSILFCGKEKSKTEAGAVPSLCSSFCCYCCCSVVLFPSTPSLIIFKIYHQILHRDNITPKSTHITADNRKKEKNKIERRKRNGNQISAKPLTHKHTLSLFIRKRLLWTHLIWETQILKVIVGEQQNKTQKIRNDGTGTFIYYIIPVEFSLSLCVCIYECVDFVFVSSK